MQQCKSYIEEKALEIQGLHDELERERQSRSILQQSTEGIGYGNAVPIPPAVGTKRQRLEELAPDLAARVINSSHAKTRNIKKEQWQAVFNALGMGDPPPDKNAASLLLLSRLLE